MSYSNGKTAKDLIKEMAGGAEGSHLSPHDIQFLALSEMINEGYDLVLKDKQKVNQAFETLQDEMPKAYDMKMKKEVTIDNEVIGNMKLAVKNKEPRYKLSYYDISNKTVQQAFDVIAAKQSHTFYVVKALVKDFAEMELPSVYVPNFAMPQATQAAPQQSTGWLDRISNWFSGFRSQRHREMMKTIEMMSGMIQDVQLCRERLNTFTRQHQEFVYLAIRWGHDTMYGYYLTEQRDFRHMKNVIEPVLDAGVTERLFMLQKLYAGMAGRITDNANIASEQKQALSNLGESIGRALQTRSAPALPASQDQNGNGQ